MCSNTRPYYQFCPSGTAINPSIKVSDFIENIGCNVPTYGPSPVPLGPGPKPNPYPLYQPGVPPLSLGSNKSPPIYEKNPRPQTTTTTEPPSTSGNIVTA